MLHTRLIRSLLAWGVAWVLLPAGGAWALRWQVQVVDRPNGAVYTSLALDRQGQPHISAFDWFNQRLTYSRFDGQVWHSEVVDGGIPNSAGDYSALALDSQDRPHISYHSLQGLRYARWDGTAWRIEAVDPQGGGYTSIALDAQDRPHISYCDCPNRVLKYARFDGTAWQVETVDSNNVAGTTSLKLDAQGHPHISYSGGRRLRYAHFDGSTWQLATVDELSAPVESTSLVLDGAGRPHIAYSGMKYARWDGSAWRSELIPDGGGDVSLALDRVGHPLMSFYHIDFTAFPLVFAVKLARFDGLAWQVETVDTQVNGKTSLGLDGQGRVHLAYSGFAPDALKYARGEPLVHLDLQLNQPGFRPGETLTLQATVTPGPVPLTADGYVAVALPGGGLLFLQADGHFTPAVQPLVCSWPVGAVSGELFRYTFTGGEPLGGYSWLAAFTQPGTLTLIEPLVLHFRIDVMVFGSHPREQGSLSWPPEPWQYL